MGILPVQAGRQSYDLCRIAVLRETEKRYKLFLLIPLRYELHFYHLFPCKFSIQ
jgi:hypothetical protein